MDHDSGNDNGWMVGLILGAAVGAIVGLLLAPTSGEETRRRIRQVAGHLGEEGRKRIDEARDYATERVDEFKDAFHAGKEAYQQARSGQRKVQGPEMGS